MEFIQKLFIVFLKRFRVRYWSSSSTKKFGIIFFLLCGVEFIRREIMKPAVAVPESEPLVVLLPFERLQVIKQLNNTLREALKKDEGMGCDIPKLDPFDREVMKNDFDPPKIVCDGKDWVTCYLSECRVRKEILMSKKYIKCLYADILFESDDNYTIGPMTKVSGDNVYTLTASDHVKVSCTGFNRIMFPTSIWSGNTLGFRSSVKPNVVEGHKEGRYNVLIFGFDSTSKNGFIRRMPKSYKILRNELNATILNSYNIVGDGTPAALLPILTGKTELELPEYRKSIDGSDYLDAMPLIFYKMKDRGYRTAYFEDSPSIGTFQFRFRGFKKQPADHYLRHFFQEQAKEYSIEWVKNDMRRFCVGDRPSYQLMMNITQQFFQLSGKHFGFTFIADITHDKFNMISNADDAFVEFLTEFKNQGRLKDTLLFVMGDHGVRYESTVRTLIQGKFEERLPLMGIILPEDLKLERPDAQEKLLSNVDTLSTPHDIYATILDAMDMRSYWNNYKVDGADLYRGLTLLETIPKNRSCSEAGIEPHWCACVRWENVTQDDDAYQNTAKALLDHLNSITESMRMKCAVRTLTSIDWVMREKIDKRLLAYERRKFGGPDIDGYVGRFGNHTKLLKETYQLKITVGPGRGVYEASMTYLKKEDRFIVSTRDISRISAYGTEPSCISEVYPHLNMFCYCK